MLALHIFEFQKVFFSRSTEIDHRQCATCISTGVEHALEIALKSETYVYTYVLRSAVTNSFAQKSRTIYRTGNKYEGRERLEKKNGGVLFFWRISRGPAAGQCVVMLL